MKENNYIELPDEEELLSDDDHLSEEEKQMYEHHRYVADKGQRPLRVDKFLHDRIESISRNRIQQAAAADCLLVNGEAVKSNYKVKPHDVVTIVMDRPRRELEIIPQDIPLEIIYKDDHLLVINKPAGMVVHPGHGNYTGTLVNALAHYLKIEQATKMGDARLGLVHRIDKETSGLLLVAKTSEAKTHLSAQFFNKTIYRRYLALVWGNVEEGEGTIIGNIGRDPRNRLLMRVFEDDEYGKPAVTHYKVIERLGYVTLVECRLETGRTHQIRVHMKHLGHTLFNDERYGGNEVLRGTQFAKYKQFVYNNFKLCPRHCLHAQSLGFVHPATGEEMLFESPLPDDINSVVERWRSYIASRDY